MTENFSTLIAGHQDASGWHVILGGRDNSRFTGHGTTGLAAHLDAERKIELGQPDYFESSEGK